MAHINGRIGSMSYNIIETMSASLTEGVELIQAKYPFYNKDTLKDDKTGKVYSVQMIQNSLKISGEMNEILQMIVFDCLIGNSDRHHSNWAEISTMDYDYGNEAFWFRWYISPLYDNGSSLCAYVNEKDVQEILKDKMRFLALLDTKSKAMIGWEDKRPIRHFELLQKVKENYYEITVKNIELIKYNINDGSIDNILNEFDDNIISSNIKKLIKMYLLERRKRMLEIYNMKD